MLELTGIVHVHRFGPIIVERLVLLRVKLLGDSSQVGDLKVMALKNVVLVDSEAEVARPGSASSETTS